MGLKESMSLMKELIKGMNVDLDKSARGNKTAAQRVRTASIAFAKVSKLFRKESLLLEIKPKRAAKKR